jgi:hypothetical protein
MGDGYLRDVVCFPYRMWVMYYVGVSLSGYSLYDGYPMYLMYKDVNLDLYLSLYSL